MTSKPVAWLRSKTTFRVPGRTVRIRLTLLYGALFLVCGAALLAVTYVLFERATSMRSASIEIPNGRPLGHTIPTLSSRAPVQKVVSIGPKALGEELKQSSDVHQLLINSAVALAIVTVVALLLGWFFAGRMLRPLRAITITARRISASNLRERLSLSGPNDEIKELGDTFDDLLGRLERSWDSQRQFVSNVSHELRSPLTRLRLQAELAATDSEATVESLQTGYTAVIAAAQQQEELISALLSLAKGQRDLIHSETFDLAPIAQTILHSQHQQVEQRALRIDADIKSAIVIGDPRLIEQLIRNLVDNAILHNNAGGEIHLTTGTEDAYGVITLSNDGPFIPATDLVRLFRPFERLEPGRRHHKNGLGLGLSIVDAIATAHGAQITVRNRTQGGLFVEVRIPRSTDTSFDAAKNATTGRPRATTDQVLERGRHS